MSKLGLTVYSSFSRKRSACSCMVHFFDAVEKANTEAVDRALTLFHLAFAIYAVYFYVVLNFGNSKVQGSIDWWVGASWSQAPFLTTVPLYEGVSRCNQLWMYVLYVILNFHHPDMFKPHSSRPFYLCKGEEVDNRKSRYLLDVSQVFMRGESKHVRHFSWMNFVWTLMALFLLSGQTLFSSMAMGCGGSRQTWGVYF